MAWEEIKKFKEYAKKFWYISFVDDKVKVIKGRTRKYFKLNDYKTSEELIKSIQEYMSNDLHYGWL